MTAQPVRLTVVPNEVEADILCGMLRANGIACLHRRTDVSSAIVSQSLGSAAYTEVLVDEHDLARARELTAGPAGD